MPRYQRFIPISVYDEAKKRIHHVYDVFDNIVVTFSGGKDSLTVMHLVKEVAEERGEGKFRVLFRDEELIHPSVADFVETYRNQDWCDLHWWCVPLSSLAYFMGDVFPVIQWDPERGPDEWARPMPEFALTEEDLGLPKGTVIEQKVADDYAARGLKGRVAVFTGIRSDESITRYRACVNKLNENYIVSSSDPRVKLVRPIFDWRMNDVFKYLMDNDIPYASIYDAQTWGGRSMRVSSALPEQAAKIMNTLPATDPDLYEMVARVFPHVYAQARYAQEMKADRLPDHYSESWDGIRAYVREKIKNPQRKAKAMAEVEACYRRAMRSPKAYPLVYVLQDLVAHGGERLIQPLSKANQASFERRADVKEKEKPRG